MNYFKRAIVNHFKIYMYIFLSFMIFGCGKTKEQLPPFQLNKPKHTNLAELSKITSDYEDTFFKDTDIEILEPKPGEILKIADKIRCRFKFLTNHLDDIPEAFNVRLTDGKKTIGNTFATPISKNEEGYHVLISEIPSPKKSGKYHIEIQAIRTLKVLDKVSGKTIKRKTFRHVYDGIDVEIK